MGIREAAATLPEDILKYVSSSKGLEERRWQGTNEKTDRERERRKGGKMKKKRKYFFYEEICTVSVSGE